MDYLLGDDTVAVDDRTVEARKLMRKIVNDLLDAMWRHINAAPSMHALNTRRDAERLTKHPRLGPILEAHRAAHKRALERFDSLAPGDIVCVRVKSHVTVRAPSASLFDPGHNLSHHFSAIVPVRLVAPTLAGNTFDPAHWALPTHSEIVDFQSKQEKKRLSLPSPALIGATTSMRLESRTNDLAADETQDVPIALGGLEEIARHERTLAASFHALFPTARPAVPFGDTFKDPRFLFDFTRSSAVDHSSHHRTCLCPRNVDLDVGLRTGGCEYGAWRIRCLGNSMGEADLMPLLPPLQLGPAAANHGGRFRYGRHPNWIRMTVGVLPLYMGARRQAADCNADVANAVALIADYLLAAHMVDIPDGGPRQYP